MIDQNIKVLFDYENHCKSYASCFFKLGSILSYLSWGLTVGSIPENCVIDTSRQWDPWIRQEMRDRSLCVRMIGIIAPENPVPEAMAKTVWLFEFIIWSFWFDNFDIICGVFRSYASWENDCYHFVIVSKSITVSLNVLVLVPHKLL